MKYGIDVILQFCLHEVLPKLIYLKNRFWDPKFTLFSYMVGMQDVKCGEGLQDFWSANFAVNTL